MHLFKFEQTDSLQDNCNNWFAFYYIFMHSVSLIPHLHNLIFSFRGKNMKYVSGSREKCSFCCWRPGILEVRCSPVLKTRHETQNCPPPVLISIFCFCSPSLNIFSQHLCSSFGLSIPQLLPLRDEEEYYTLAGEACENIPPWRTGCQVLVFLHHYFYLLVLRRFSRVAEINPADWYLEGL